MKSQTKYAYEKRIKELETKITRLESDLYQFHSACSEIYNGITEVLAKSQLNMPCAWLLDRLKRAWRPLL